MTIWIFSFSYLCTSHIHSFDAQLVNNKMGKGSGWLFFFGFWMVFFFTNMWMIFPSQYHALHTCCNIGSYSNLEEHAHTLWSCVLPYISYFTILLSKYSIYKGSCHPSFPYNIWMKGIHPFKIASGGWYYTFIYYLICILIHFNLFSIIT